MPSAPPDADADRAASERLFLALWPDDDVRGRLAQVCSSLRLRGGRLIAPENFHVTLVFLGNVTAERRLCIERAMESLRARGFEFALTYAEWRRRTGIFWLGADDEAPALDDLVSRLNVVASECGHTPETRRYRLHVTLARDVARGPRRQPIAPIRWQARAVSLVLSCAAAKGSEYRVLRQWPLMS